jgi:AcrR family transcriptional regulator
MAAADGGAGPRTSRAYNSRVRAERGAETRRRIAAAAGELFAEHGFAGTTVARIAQRAGVATPTVYATFGSKAAIVRALLDQMEHNADGADWAQRIAEETHPYRKLEAFAIWSTGLYSSSKEAVRVARGAAGDPAIVTLQEEGNRHRREALREVIASLALLGALAPELSQERAVDRAWMLTSIELYFSATETCGWSDTEYQEWLTGLLQDQLLGP